MGAPPNPTFAPPLSSVAEPKFETSGSGITDTGTGSAVKKAVAFTAWGALPGCVLELVTIIVDGSRRSKLTVRFLSSKELQETNVLVLLPWDSRLRRSTPQLGLDHALQP